MLLRRVIDRVRAQNWRAVAIDFVIVVLGVFVGLHVNNWNAAHASPPSIIFTTRRSSENFPRASFFRQKPGPLAALLRRL
ncbi:MAG: hypothetical protein U5J99_11755 [Parvularculaceae bacterium]|nr:hypothetical protein [Parvularculaceae bacterium]